MKRSSSSSAPPAKRTKVVDSDEEDGDESSHVIVHDDFSSDSDDDADSADDAPALEMKPETQQDGDEDPTTQIEDVEFQFWDPKPVDYHTLKIWLQKTTDSLEFDAAGLADIVSAQAAVGTMIKQGDDGNVQPIGFASTLSWATHRSTRSFAQIRKFVLAHVPANQRQQLESVLDSNQTGLLLQDRLINTPPELVPPLHDNLQQDVAWAKDNESSEALCNSFRFSDVLVLIRCFQTPEDANAPAIPKIKHVPEGFCLYKFEEEALLKHSKLAFSFDAARPPPEKDTNTKNLVEKRIVAVVPFAKLDKALAETWDLLARFS